MDTPDFSVELEIRPPPHGLNAYMDTKAFVGFSPKMYLVYVHIYLVWSLRFTSPTMD
jgi:hypothetical protein